MALQTTVDLNLTKYIAGQRTASANPHGERSASWQGANTNGVIFGTFVARGDTPSEARALATSSTLLDVFGIVENDFLHEIEIDGSTARAINQNDALSIITRGSVIVRTDGTAIATSVTPIYIITASATASDVGKITSDNSAGTARLQIGGTGYTGPGPMAIPYDTATTADTLIELALASI